MRIAYLVPDGRLRIPTSRMIVLSAMLALTTACASQSGDHLLAQRDSPVMGCPTGSIRTCEVIGGNKFSKRYGRCECWRR